MYELTMNDHYAMYTFHDLLLTLFKGLTKFFHVVYSRKQVKKISWRQKSETILSGIEIEKIWYYLSFLDVGDDVDIVWRMTAKMLCKISIRNEERARKGFSARLGLKWD